MHRQDRQCERLIAEATKEITETIADDPLRAWWLYRQYGQDALRPLTPSTKDHAGLVELAPSFTIEVLRAAREQVSERIETHRNIAAGYAAEAKELGSQIAALEKASKE